LIVLLPMSIDARVVIPREFSRVPPSARVKPA
jgi:hypothetical protein